MNGNLRVWVPASALAAVAIAAGGFLLGVQPALASASNDDQAAAAADAQQQAVDVKLTRLSAVAAHQSELDAKKVVLGKAVPSTLKANTFIQRMNELSALDGVVINAVSPGVGVAYLSNSTSSGTTGTAGAGVYGATDPLITPKNFTVVPMAVIATGSRSALLQFTHDAQNDERLFLVSEYALAPTADGASEWTVTLSGSVYAVER